MIKLTKSRVMDPQTETRTVLPLHVESYIKGPLPLETWEVGCTTVVPQDTFSEKSHVKYYCRLSPKSLRD